MILTPPDNITPVSGNTALDRYGSGVITSNIDLTIAHTNDDFVDFYDIQWKTNTQDDYINGTRIPANPKTYRIQNTPGWKTYTI